MIYLANDKYSSNFSAGYTAGQGTMSVNAVPENVPTIITIAKGTDKYAVYSVTGKTSNSLTGVTRLRGYAGNYDANTAITCLNNKEYINQYSSVVSTPETLKPLIYGVDGGSSDSYAISLDTPIVDYFSGLLIAFKANTANTGAATLNVDGKGAKTIKKNATEDLTTNDIKSGEIVTVIYDGTNFQLQTGIPMILNRAFTWYLDGTSVDGVAGAVYIAPQNMTVTKIYGLLTSGTCVGTLKKGATTIDVISCSNALATETSITDGAITAGDVITLTLSSSSAPVGLKITMEATQP